MNNKTIFVGHHLWGGISAYILARKYNKKSVWMLYCTLGAYGLLWDLFETIIINKIAHNFDKIMILDDGSNIISKLKQKIKTKKLIVFPQAVNPVFVTQPKNNTKHNSFCIIHTAGLNKAKNPELVIEAANLLRNQDFKFHIYGEGKQKKILERNIIKMQLQNIVYIHNRKTINDIIKIMDNANIMLITSRNNSCFGRVAIESLARKLPIIATNSGRTNKLLPNNKLAIICEPTPKSLAKSIIYAKNNPQILKTITKNGFKAIKTKYNYSIRGNIIKNAFLNLIGENYD
jgi:glycosyltransferase involved in cell wall biosynthesis